MMEKIRLGDIATTITKGTTPTTIGFPFVDTGINFVKIESIDEAGNFLPDRFAHITDECNRKLGRSILEENDILFSIAGAIGRTAIVPKSIIPANTNQALAIIRIPSNAINLQFVLYALQSRAVAEQSEKQKQGVAQLNLSLKNIADIQIPLASSEKQAEIVRILAALDVTIGQRKEQIKLIDQLVKSRFIELFGDPIMNPRGWQTMALEDNATLLNGRAYKQDELLDSGKYPVLRVGNFFSNRGWYYSNLELNEDKYCDNGDLLYAWSASFGPQIWNGGKVIYHYHIWKVLVGKAYNKQFLCNLLEYTTESLMNDTHGIAMMHLTKSGMEKTEFIVPPLELQEQFAAFVEQTDKSKLAVQKGLQELEILKKSLMQQYFG